MALQEIMELWQKLWKKFILIARATPTVEPNIEVEHVASTLFAFCQMNGIDEAPDVSAPMYCLVVEVLGLLTETFDYSKLGKGPIECKCCKLTSFHLLEVCCASSIIFLLTLKLTKPIMNLSW